MMWIETPQGYVLRFLHGEEVFSGLVAFADERDIGGAWVQGLGALRRAEIGYYDLATKSYLRKEIDEEVEIASLVGNLSRYEGKPVPHVHVTLGRRDFSALGGHLFMGEAGATVEISVVSYAGVTLERAADAAIGLNLLDLPETKAPAG